MNSASSSLRDRFAPLQAKTLKNALAHRIRRECPRIGGPRIGQLCAEMVLEVVQRHFRSKDHLTHGQVLWLAVAVDDPPRRHQTIAETELVPERAEEPAAPAPQEKPTQAVPAAAIAEGRMKSYERVTADTLRALCAAQATFVARCIVDQDGDGAGEYGFLRELTGASVARTRVAALPSGELLSAALGYVNASGVAVKVGYCHMVYLPTRSGVAATESGGRLRQADAGDANPQETRWIAYAWPRQYGVTGRRVFAVNQGGEVYVASNQRPDGTPFYTGDGTGAEDARVV